MSDDYLPDLEQMERETGDATDIKDTQIKINPSFYIHTALLKSQDCLIKDDVKGGLLQYRIIIAHLEGIARAANMLGADYDEELKEKTATITEQDQYIRQALITNLKAELILKYVFDSRAMSGILKL